MFFITQAESLIKELIKYNVLGEIHPLQLEYLDNKYKIQSDYAKRFGTQKIDNISKTRQTSREKADDSNIEMQYNIELFEVAWPKQNKKTKNSIQEN